MDAGNPIVVFSHLRWDFVFQRPQHILSRLSKTNPIHYIEEPIIDSAKAGTWTIRSVDPNITVYQPHTNITEHGFHPTQIPILKKMLTEMPNLKALQNPYVWVYTPMAVELVRSLSPSMIIYDSMDALDAFNGAHPELLENENELLLDADIVFTGGRSLYHRMHQRHSNVHCFPSSVDASHFAMAKTDKMASSVIDKRPTLGYFGVIDERIDYPLLAGIADARPHWQIVMVGPVVKVDESALPHRDNIHYLGQKPYEKLPFYLADWDVCLLPFARNDATRHISPTKTLEYMAAGKLIVGTPIPDVAEIYADVVHIADNVDAFVKACESCLDNDEENAQRIRRANEVIRRTSWDRTVQQMRDAIAHKSRSQPTNNEIESNPVDATDSRLSHHPVVIIGAGPTGLSAAYHAGRDSLLLEKNDRVGGWCRSIESNGFTFDFAGHIMFSNDSYVQELYKLLLGDNVHWQDREAWIYSKRVYTRYPFQASLYGLPAEVIEECLLGAIEARYGSIGDNAGESKPPNGNGNSTRTASLPLTPTIASNGNNGKHGTPSKRHCASHGLSDCCGDGILETTAELGLPVDSRRSSASPTTDNFEDFIYRVWGKGIAKHFAIPYNRKLWAVPLHEMETSWLGGRVPMPNLQEMIEGALRPSIKPMGPNARFGYPLRGGFQALMDGFLDHLQGEYRLNTAVRRISVIEKKIETSNDEILEFDTLISTMPLPVLVKMIGAEAPAKIRQAAARLRNVSVRCVNIGVGRSNVTDKHWIYYPEDTVFHRIFVQGNASPHCNPEGGFGLTCEITYSSYKPLPVDGDALIQRCIEDCIKVGIISKDDPIWEANQVDLPFAYVVYDHERKESVNLIREWMAQHDIILAGRYSEWEYYNSDHAFLAGRRAAQEAKSILTNSSSEQPSHQMNH
ncbi:FAD-dependent oxidoreductase [bacterium]|nr:FAD-dependent oxidoreductase [bacterium]